MVRILLGGERMVYQESETVEWKSIVVDNIKKEIIAFANCEGGKLYIGVRDDGTVIALAKEQGIFTRKDVEKALGISQTTSGRLLRQMSRNGQIVQEGKSRNTHYRLSE